MATLETDLRLQNVIDNSAETVIVPSGKKFRIKRLTNRPAAMIGRLITKGHISAESTEEGDFVNMAINMNHNRELMPKVASIAILHNPVKIFLFHWIYWRYLNQVLEQRDFKVMFDFIYGQEEIKDFFFNMAFLRRQNLIATMPAQKTPTTTTTEAKQD